MKMYMIAVHYNSPNKKNIVGFRILDLDSREVKDYDYQAVKNVLARHIAPITGLTYDSRKGELKGSNGALDRYPALLTGKPLNRSLVILNSIDDKGYQVSSFNGKVADALRSDVVAFAIKAGIANGKVVEKDGKKFISAINGTYSNIPFAQSQLSKVKSIQNKQKDEQLLNKQKTEMQKKQLVSKTGFVDKPRVVTSQESDPALLQLYDDVSQATVEQKMAYIMIALKKIRPFCYGVYVCLNRVATLNVKTMGVSLRTLYFNPYFVLEMSLPELLFVAIHEIYHISMKHKIREQNRKHKTWNKACDYYINKQIAVEFGLVNVGEAKKTIGDNHKETSYMIAIPDDALYNKMVDVDTDTPESIYEELMDIQNQKQQQKQQEQDSNGSDSGDSSESGGSGGGDLDEQNEDNEQTNSNKNEQRDNQEESNEGDNEQSDEENNPLDDLADGKDTQQGNDGEEDDSEGYDDMQDDEDKQEGNENGTGNQSDEEDSEESEGKDGKGNKQDSQSTDSGDGEEDELVGETFRGQEIPDIEDDIVDSPDERGETSDRSEQIANSILKRAASICRQQKGTFGGEAGSWIERCVEKALAPKVNWASILRNKLTLASQKINTFAAPDKRFRSRGMVLPGPKKLESDTLENVKVCVDTSGSISEKDLGIALAQVEQLLKTFKAEAELMYWDTQIRAIYPFKDIKDIISKKPEGGGGTDANCIFRYFEETRDYKIGKKPKPKIIIVFTDGYFGTISNKYSKYRDTIWVVAGNDGFTPPFGTKAPFKHDN